MGFQLTVTPWVRACANATLARNPSRRVKATNGVATEMDTMSRGAAPAGGAVAGVVVRVMLDRADGLGVYVMLVASATVA